MHRKQSIYISVDVVIFTIIDNKLSVLLINRKYEPYKGKWALPGGFVENGETLDQAMRREIREETGIEDIFLVELKNFSRLDRDPRDRVISVSYMGIIRGDIAVKGGTDAERAMFCPIANLPELAFDHKEMVMYARKYLAIHLWASSLGEQFLPAYFSLTELQDVYECIAVRTREIRNFRKKILSRGVVKPSKKYEQSVGHRPARLYEFTHKRNYLLP